MKRTLMLAATLTAVTGSAMAREAVWIEGERPARHNFFKHAWYHNVKTDQLSGGEWLSHYDKRHPGEAEYRFTVKEGGRYTWWLRCNVALMTQSYSLDGAAPVAMDLKKTAGQRINISPQKIDHRFLAWVNAGELALKPGEHTIRVITTSEIANHGGIDCTCLANFDWTPSGTRKPPGAIGQRGTGAKLPHGQVPAAPPSAQAPEAPGGGDRPDAMAVEGKGEYVWIEGEKPGESNFKRHGWYDGVNKSLLSGNEWLSHYDKGARGEATYKFTLKQGGRYTWWLRCNVVLMTQHYSLDTGQPVEMDLTGDVRGRMNLVARPDHRFIGWVKAGRFDLAPGEHTVKIVTSSKIANHGGIDCMCFTNFSWAPAGTQKPLLSTDEVARKPDSWFPVLPDDDEFSPASIIDMSGLMHAPAGKFGFVQRKGAGFVLSETGRPVKFWGIVANMTSAAALRDQQARLYAKHGVNMVRQHPVEAVVGVLAKDPASGQRRFDPGRLDEWDKWFATLKKRGIYVTWSCFYPHVTTPDDGYPDELYNELKEARGGRSSSGMVNFVQPLQDAEWEWLRTMLLHKNPHTGLRYVDDPALAIVEVHNEDCIFWHAPLNDLAAGKKFPRHTAVLKRMWQEWLKKRYAGDGELKKAWGNGIRRGDSLDNPAMGIYGAWEMEADGPRMNKREKARLGDFVRFLAETQRAYYDRRYRRLRDLGYQGVIVSTAWRAGGPAADPANLWCDDRMDCITRHNYFGGGAGGHGIAPGKVNNESHMDQPGSHLLSTGFYQVEDKPLIVTEWTQLPPNQWKAEAAPLVAFYGMGLQGWDASYQFAGSRPRMGSGWPDMRSYVTETPHYLGQFPALAFAIYKGHLSEAPPAAARRVRLDEVFRGVDALSQDFSGGGYDQKELRGNLATPKEVLAIGRVTARIGDGPQRSAAVDWTAYWDKDEKLVRSMTRQLSWHYGKRVVAVHTPKTQGVIGFAGGGRYRLPGVTVAVKTPFVSLLFTPLDDRPLVESKHILITAMARDSQTGTRYSADGTQLIDAGKPPLLMEPVQAELEFKGPPIQSVKVVDIYGVPTDKEVERDGNRVTIDGRYATYYYEVKR